MTKALSIWLVEDEQIFRDSFEELIELEDEFQLTAAFETYEELQSHCRATPRLELPDLVAMDIRLPGKSGIEATRELCKTYPDLRVLALTQKDDPDSVFAILEAGACGYVVKGATKSDSLIAAMRETIEGGAVFSPAVARHVLRQFEAAPPLEDPLSVRERQVLLQLSKGGTKSGIGETLCLSRHTVDTHLRNVYRKLHANTGAEAVAKGIRSGII